MKCVRVRLCVVVVMAVCVCGGGARTKLETLWCREFRLARAVAHWAGVHQCFVVIPREWMDGMAGSNGGSGECGRVQAVRD